MDQEKETKQLFFTLDEVRKIVFQNHISKSTLINMIRAKQLPVTKMMHRNFVPRWWILEQVNKATIKPNIKEERLEDR